MGRDKKTALMEKLLYSIETENFKDALKTLKEMNTLDFVKSLDKKEAARLYSLLLATEKKMNLFKKEILSSIGNREKIRKAYLK